MNNFQEGIIKRAVENMDSLNDWEKQFIESIKRLLGSNIKLSAKQNASLNKIADKVYN